jgi:hypothetical protein
MISFYSHDEQPLNHDYRYTNVSLGITHPMLTDCLIVLPDSEKFKGLSRTWEAKLKKLETKLDE